MNLSIYSSIKQASEKTGKSQLQIRNAIKYKYGKNIKTKCVNCGCKIKYSIARYLTRGNVCPKCNTNCQHFIDARLIYQRTANSNEKVKADSKKLRKLLKQYNIKSEDLFVSINFQNSFNEILKKSQNTNIVRP